MDYYVPRAADVPHVELHHLVFPSSNNPLGVKSVGESGPISPPAAIASAIEDALDGALKITRLPITAGTIIAACRTNSEA
jgi:aerobic carbon-monoxide dehydrogenase large subunit